MFILYQYQGHVSGARCDSRTSSIHKHIGTMQWIYDVLSGVTLELITDSINLSQLFERRKLTVRSFKLQ
jgi:hypothetical protein